MLTIHLVAVGAKTPHWVQQGWREYAKRIRGRCALELIEVGALRRGNNPDLAAIARREGARLQRAIPAGSRVIALDRAGKAHSTAQIARRMEAWMRDGARTSQVALLAGGAEGLAPPVLDAADEIWSLSAMTFAHPLVRVIIAEQIYRCYSLLEGLPYHR
ncbi:MAG: 23S rRNA (pseudouridine(1915)-N(3))-methyltransferase RlmH [bacterium]